MKRTIKHLTLAVVIATVTTGAHAAWTDTVKGYWNSAYAKATTAAHDTKNFFERSWFFTTQLYELKQICAKLQAKQEITSDEYQAVKKAIGYSTLSEQDKARCYTAFDRAPGILTVPMAGVAPVEGFTLKTATQKLDAIIQAEQSKRIKAIAAVTTGIAAIYAYKRLTARPAIPGWCA